MVNLVRLNTHKHTILHNVKYKTCNIEIQYKPGKDNHGADLLSRAKSLMDIVVCALGEVYFLPVATRSQSKAVTSPPATASQQVRFPSQPVSHIKIIKPEGKNRSTGQSASLTSKSPKTGTLRAQIIQRANAAMQQHPDSYTFSQPAHIPPRVESSDTR